MGRHFTLWGTIEARLAMVLLLVSVVRRSDVIYCNASDIGLLILVCNVGEFVVLCFFCCLDSESLLKKITGYLDNC